VGYQFAASPPAHHVAIAGGPRVHAMCAIDALGIPAMLHADAVITSSDPLTGKPVTITFAAGTASWDPPGVVAFADCARGDGPAEKVSCGYLNFFARPASAPDWASHHARVTSTVPEQATTDAVGAQTFTGVAR